MKLCMAGIDASAPFEEREKLSLVRGQVQAMLPRIAEQTGCAAVLLATCSRTELYLHAEGERALPTRRKRSAVRQAWRRVRL